MPWQAGYLIAFCTLTLVLASLPQLHDVLGVGPLPLSQIYLGQWHYRAGRWISQLLLFIIGH